jgi:hypothetical protein
MSDSSTPTAGLPTIFELGRPSRRSGAQLVAAPDAGEALSGVAESAAGAEGTQ